MGPSRPNPLGRRGVAVDLFVVRRSASNQGPFHPQQMACYSWDRTLEACLVHFAESIFLNDVPHAFLRSSQMACMPGSGMTGHIPRNTKSSDPVLTMV